MQILNPPTYKANVGICNHPRETNPCLITWFDLLTDAAGVLGRSPNIVGQQELLPEPAGDGKQVLHKGAAGEGTRACSRARMLTYGELNGRAPSVI